MKWPEIHYYYFIIIPPPPLPGEKKLQLLSLMVKQGSDWYEHCRQLIPLFDYKGLTRRIKFPFPPPLAYLIPFYQREGEGGVDLISKPHYY